MSAKKYSIKLENVNVEGVNSQLRVQNLKNIFISLDNNNQDNIRVPILRNINFTAKEGERVGIVGKNGCGKSSLLKVIAGIYPPKSGNMEINGKVAPIIEMGVGFANEFTGRENIKIGLLYNGRLEEYSKELEDKIIESSGLKEKIDLPFKYYSSGMKARLAFSISIFQHPDILLLDEVFAAGDKEFITNSKELLIDKFKSVPISVFVSHTPELVRELCNRCVLMENGKIIDDGTPEYILERYEEC
jgi:ABC-type polysaccharide/polyol phosphate transport system ATPase subunit